MLFLDWLGSKVATRSFVRFAFGNEVRVKGTKRAEMLDVKIKKRQNIRSIALSLRTWFVPKDVVWDLYCCFQISHVNPAFCHAACIWEW